MTEFGLKEDTTLSKWIPFTNDKEFVVAKTNVVVISVATVELAHYYEVVLQKIGETDEKLALRPPLSSAEIDRILDMCRTVVNVTGDATVATIVGSSEGDLNVVTDDELEKLETA